MSYHTLLPERGVIAFTGEDADEFLQGIVSNDVAKVTQTQAGYGAFLTPQGKYLFDFFMVRTDRGLLMETEQERIGAFIKRLSMYKLRANVEITDASAHYTVGVIFGDGATGSLSGTSKDMIIFVDPRLDDAGLRVIAPIATPDLAIPESQKTSPDDYDQHRIGLGLPDGSRDLIIEKSVLLENGFDELNGVDWSKGCYMGQEVTARTKHRGLVKKRLMPVAIAGDPPESGSPVMLGEREAGEMRSSNGAVGLAIIKLDYLDDGVTFRAGNAVLTPRKPSWATF